MWPYRTKGPKEGTLHTLIGPRTPKKGLTWPIRDQRPREGLIRIHTRPRTLPPPPNHLVLGELGGVLQGHVLLLGRGVAGGQGQAPQGVPPRPPLLDDGEDLLLDGRRQGDPRGAHPDVVTAVDDALGGTLRRGRGREEVVTGVRGGGDAGTGLTLTNILLPTAAREALAGEQ